LEGKIFPYGGKNFRSPKDGIVKNPLISKEFIGSGVGMDVASIPWVI
jgi:hypothetical protein